MAQGLAPLDDIAVLTEPANITHVWKAGVAVKAPPGDGQWRP